MGVTLEKALGTTGPRLPRKAVTTSSALLLGEKIRAAREKLGWSQLELANRVGSISKNSVSLWESGKTRPATGHLIKLPTILGVDSAWLFSDEAAVNIEVPILSAVAAGKLEPREPVELWHDVPRVVAAGLPPGRWIALYVEGNSMNLIAVEGSIIFVNRDETELVSGKLYVIAAEDGSSTFKRYRSNPDRFEPVSADRSHETIFPEGQVRIVGRVMRMQADL